MCGSAWARLPPTVATLRTRTLESVRSVRVSMAGRPWQVGQPFQNPAALTTCDCDDEPDRTICYTKGEHVAVLVCGANTTAVKFEG